MRTEKTSRARVDSPEEGSSDHPESPVRRLPETVLVERRGPILRAAKSKSKPNRNGTYGIDLTAGCMVDCPFCHIRASSFYPGEGRILFDPATAERLSEELKTLKELPRRVVLSPTSEPLPPSRDVRRETSRVIDLLLDRGIDVVLVTRGRIDRKTIARFAKSLDRVRVAIPFVSLDWKLHRALEPLAARPEVRVRQIARLIDAGVPVEARVEPIITRLNDTREALSPLFRALAAAGVRDVLAHHLFVIPAMLEPLQKALVPFSLAERLAEDYRGGPVFSLGSVGSTKHLPLDRRRESLARVAAFAAEHGILIQTGATQNPDFRREEPEAKLKSKRDRQENLLAV